MTLYIVLPAPSYAIIGSKENRILSTFSEDIKPGKNISEVRYYCIDPRKNFVSRYRKLVKDRENIRGIVCH